MTAPNNFSGYYKTLSNTGLLDILENQENYQPLAVIAAKTEFERRQLSAKEMSEARQPLITKRLEKAKQKDKIKAIQERAKYIGNSFAGTVNPIQKETASGDKVISTITVVFSALFIYQIISKFRLLTLMIKDIPRFDFSSFFYFLPLVVLLAAIFTFWRRMVTGWIILSFYLVYSAIGAFWGLMENLTGKPSGVAVLDNLFPGPASATCIIQLFFLGGTLYVLCKPNIRKIYKIGKQKMIVTLLISGLLTLFLLFVIL